MAADAEPYSVAARKLGRTRAADEAAARDEVVTRAEATLAALSARFEVRKEVTAGPAAAPARDRYRHGPFRRLADGAARTAWDHMLPEQARTRLRTAGPGMARGIIEPSARRFTRHQVEWDPGMLALAMFISRPQQGLDSVPDAHVEKENPVELLMRLRSVTAARYAGEETVRETRCRKIAVTVSGTAAGCTVWVDNKYVRQIRAVTPATQQGVVTMLVTTTVTAQLWDFGVPVDSVDWPPLPPRAVRALPLIQRRARFGPAPRSGHGTLGASQR
jgi:hypothetical protein